MSKNKGMWSLAIVMIALLALPIVNAQIASTLAGINWFYLLANAAVIGFILFILQSFLVPNKPDKERTSMWFIIVIISLVIAYLYGSSDYVWRSGPLSAIMDIHVIVNTFVISVILYFALAFVPKLDLRSPEGQTGKIIIVILIGAAIAFNMSHDRFIWHNDNVRAAIGYMFSGEMLTRPDGTKVAKGMMHPQGGLFVLVSSFIIISFFLNSYLLKSGNQTVNYMLAGLFAFVMASPPSSPLSTVVMLGEFFFIFIFWGPLKETLGEIKIKNFNAGAWISLFMSVIIVSLASAAITMNSPEYRGILGSIGCHLPLIGVDCMDSTGSTTMTGSATTKGTRVGSLIVFIIEMIIVVAAIAGIFALYKKYWSGGAGGAGAAGGAAGGGAGGAAGGAGAGGAGATGAGGAAGAAGAGGGAGAAGAGGGAGAAGAGGGAGGGAGAGGGP